MTPLLPYETWVQITSYLDPSDVQRLLPVNRILFDIAMSQRYETSWIGATQHNVRGRALMHLYKNAEAVRRVKTLYIRNGPLTIKSSTIKTFFRKLKGEAKQQEQDFRKLVVGVAALTGVATLHLELNGSGHDGHQHKLSLLRGAWSAFTSSLRSLILHLAVEDIADALNRGTVHLPHLDELSVRIFNRYQTSDNAALLQDTLLPFLQTNCASLRSLELVCQTNVDLTATLMRAPHLSSLTSLRIAETLVGFAKSSLRGHSHFLGLHRNQLQRLVMEFFPPLEWYNPMPTPADWYAQEWLLLTFPCLEIVDVGLKTGGTLQAAYSSGAIEHCLRHATTLRSLALQNVTLNRYHLDSLLTEKRFQFLNCLDIVLNEFTPSTLQILKDGLPQLRDLHFRVFRIPEPFHVTDNSRVDHYELTEFCEALKALSLKDWTLRSFDIKTFSLTAFNSCVFARSLALAIPSLTFYRHLQFEMQIGD